MMQKRVEKRPFDHFALANSPRVKIKLSAIEPSALTVTVTKRKPNYIPKDRDKRICRDSRNTTLIKKPINNRDFVLEFDRNLKFTS